MASMFFGRPKIDLSDDLRAAETQHYLEERIPGLEFRWFHNCRHIFRNVTVDAFGETGRVPEPPREMWARSEYEHSSSDDD